MTIELVLQSYEKTRSDLAVEAAKLVDDIKQIIEKYYQIPQSELNRRQLQNKEFSETGSVLIGFYLRNSHNDAWHKSLSYRLSISDYSRESNGKMKVLRGLSDKQKANARRRNYRLPTKDDGYCTTEILQKHMNVFEYDFYTEMLDKLIPVMSVYRYLQHCYRESLMSERLMLRQYCINKNLEVPNRSTASLEMLRSVVEEHVTEIQIGVN